MINIQILKREGEGTEYSLGKGRGHPRRGTVKPRGRGWDGLLQGWFPDGVKREGKLTHRTHIHTGNFIFGRGRNEGEGQDGTGMGMVATWWL